MILNRVSSRACKVLILSLLGLSLSSCSGGAASSNATNPSVNGYDLSGTWRLAGVECYDSSLSTVTVYGTVAAGSATSTSIINGNTIETSTIGTGSCRYDTTSSIVANLTNGTLGTVTFGDSTVNVTTGASCSTSISFDLTGGTLTPAIINATVNDGETRAGYDTEFITNPPYLAFTSLLQVDGSPTDVCFLIYQEL